MSSANVPGAEEQESIKLSEHQREAFFIEADRLGSLVLGLTDNPALTFVLNQQLSALKNDPDRAMTVLLSVARHIQTSAKRISEAESQSEISALGVTHV